jgi:hypothetical protein
MNRHHTGSGRRRVIPADWATAHAGVAEGTHTATVEIRPPGSATAFDAVTGQTKTTAPEPTYDGPAAIWPTTTGSEIVSVADDEVALRRYLVAITRGAAGITAEHRVKVTACSEAALVGRTLQISVVGHDSEGFETLLHCTLTD